MNQGHRRWTGAPQRVDPTPIAEPGWTPRSPTLGWSTSKGLTQLQSLDLAGTQVTDAGLEHLKGLTQLQSLDLGQTQVTDAGLEHLKGLTQLQSLNLGDTKVTDAGLEHSKG